MMGMGAEPNLPRGRFCLVTQCSSFYVTRQKRLRGRVRRAFPSSPGPLYEERGSVLNMIFHSQANKNSFSQERLCTWPHFESEGFWSALKHAQK